MTQLEKLIADRRLTLEKEGLAESSATNVVLSSAAQAVGNLCYTEVCIEGLPVKAMVDTGAQSTIIYQTLIHAINRHVKQQGRELPPLKLPSARLYGKDGEKGGQELLITAQVNLVVSLGDCSVTVPIFNLYSLIVSKTVYLVSMRFHCWEFKCQSLMVTLF